MIDFISPELISAFETWFDHQQWIHREQAFDDVMKLQQLEDLSQSDFVTFLYKFAHTGGGIQSGGHRTSKKLREVLEAQYHEFREYLLEPFYEQFNVKSWLDRVSQFNYWGSGIATIYLCRINRRRFTVVNDKSIKALALLGIKTPASALSAKYSAILNSQAEILEAYPSLDNYQRIDALFHFIVAEGGHDLLPRVSLESPKRRTRFSMKKRFNPVLKTLILAKNLVLEGVPGTGKTYAIKSEICKVWPTPDTLKGYGTGAYAITLHPATSYEDFVEGLRPSAPQSVPTTGAGSPGPSPIHQAAPVSLCGTGCEVISGEEYLSHRYFHVEQCVNQVEDSVLSTSPSFTVQDGFFLKVCAEAANNPHRQYIVLLDEINRCNVPKVMGDLLTTLERSKRAQWCDLEHIDHTEGITEDIEGYWDLSKCQVVTLPNSKRLFFVPENIYVVATMNTTDRSIAPLDAALRRRFAFFRLWPKGFEAHDLGLNLNKVIQVWTETTDGDHESVIGRLLWSNDAASEIFFSALKAWGMINLRLRIRGPDTMLGHSYLFDLADDLINAPFSESEVMLHHWNHHLLPQLIDLAVSHHFVEELIGDEEGSLTSGLFVGTQFKLEGTLPHGRGLLVVPTLILKVISVTVVPKDQES